MDRAAIATALILAACGTAWAQAPDAKTAPEPCDGVIDPYNPMDERDRFFQAAGLDSELDRNEFAADQAGGGAAAGFVRKFDRWPLMLAFDKNRNRKIDWFEADAYRKALRQRVVAAFDADEDGQLTGAERDAANRALAAGSTSPLPAGTSRPAPPETAPAATQPDQDPREFVRKYDANRDGKLDEGERQTVREILRKRMAETRRKYELWRHDSNGDGRLSRQEQEALAARNADLQASMAKKRKDWIEKYDTNRDGRISPEERRAALRAVAEEHRKETLAKHDANHDGRLDEKERAGLQKAWRERMAEQRKSRELAEFDRNGNGRIDDSEHRAQEEFRQEGQRARGEWMRSFDLDADGTLSDEERRAMHLSPWRDPAGEAGRDTDAGQDGQDALGGEDSPDFGDDDPNASYRERLLKKYDTDGDGYLNTQERARMWRDLYVQGLRSDDEKPRDKD